ncbi:MAG: SDR family oxidoreductase [Betaproteobacteria bacterium]|nr:SDR family oxidoreductase [Betaproteobacteria bacterium]
MELELKGKRVLITGASKGIGLACAAHFLREGAQVCIVSRQQKHLDEAMAHLQQQRPLNANEQSSIRANDQSSIRAKEQSSVECLPPIHRCADLCDASQAQALVAELERIWGAIDILVNSAGAARRTPAAELSAQAYADAMQAKYFSYTNVIDPCIKAMASRGHGVIVNVIGAGGKVASPIHIPGGAANAALMLVTAGLANAYAHQGVRVVAVNPGLTLTARLEEGLVADARAQGITAEEAQRRATAKIPMGRIAHPDEVADTVVYLASARASYVTGVSIAMDGSTTPLI